jgi:phage shock protein PspC (stress-responsive transcriptional regulator)
MNKVITINLNGNAYQLEEDGYDALRAYLEAAARGLTGNPDRDEIIADIEQAIADKFRAVLGAKKTVVVSKEVRDVIAQMGPVQDDSGSAAGGQAAPGGGPAATPGAAAGAPKRLYRIREGAQLAGVCNGLAAYFGIDVTLIRILFAVCVLSFGAGVLLYIVMMFVIPAANTPEEMAAAQGIPATAEDFIKRAREGYYGGMKAFGDRRAFKEWKRQFKRDMRQNAQQWRQDWHQRGAAGGPPHPRAWAFGSLVGIILSALSLLCVFTVISLILTGGVLGFFPPFGMPLWLAVILTIIVFKLIKWPFRVMRYGAYYGGYGGYMGPFACLWHSVGWLLLVLLFVWFADHHWVLAHDILHRLSHAAHRTVDAIREWWAQQ